MPDASPPGPSRGKLSAGTKVAKLGSSADAGSDIKKRFEVKKVFYMNPDEETRPANGSKWNAVALWAWDIVVDNCAICRNHIMDLCMSAANLVIDAAPDLGSRYRMSSKSSFSYERRMHGRLGHLQRKLFDHDQAYIC